MTRLFCFAGVVLAILAIDAVASGAEKPKAPAAAEPAQKLTEADNGKTIKLKVGDLVTISLKGNPTTGYSWRTGKLDGTAVEQAGEPKYTTDPHGQGMVGVGGTFLFKFNAAKVGKTEVNLEYVRPWEKGTKPVKTFAATIEVESK
jgi:inhibitor of cysteine peptidase